MKLSDAMALGSTLHKPVKGDWNYCALGLAANAVGIERAVSTKLMGEEIGTTHLRVAAIRRQWPWLISDSNLTIRELLEDEDPEDYITEEFDDEVCSGNRTLKDLIRWVRRVEPDCGTCNRRVCLCPAPARFEEADNANDLNSTTGSKNAHLYQSPSRP